jgi:phage terminase large subunit GpA-like protein
MHLLPDLPPYISGANLVADAFGALAPRARISVLDWTHGERFVRGVSAGLWDPTVAPYLEEPMAQFDAVGVEEIALIGPGRSGKTTVAENVLLKTIKADAAPVGWYANTDDVMKAYVKTGINPLLDDHNCVRAGDDTADSLSFKRFIGGTEVQFLAATDAAFRNKTFRYVIGDEFDGYDPSLGDARGLLNLRRATEGAAGRSLFISHPDLAEGVHPSEWRRGIMAIYAASTRCTWWWPCPHCGGWSSPNPGTARHMTLNYPENAPLDRIASATRMFCPVNGCLIEDHERRAMNLQGRWLGTGESMATDGTVTGTRAANTVAGYWIVGLMSPFLLGGIGNLARARVEAERAVAAGEENAERTLRQVLTKQWGIPYTKPKGAAALDADIIAERADERLQLGVVPEGVRFLVTAIDNQSDRFEVLTRGFGPGFESWVIDHRRIEADPAHDLADWEKLLTTEMARTYPLADDSDRRMRVRAVGFDSAGMPGVTENAYEAWKRLRDRRVARLLGHVSGRDAWNLLPTKGAVTRDGTRLRIEYPDSARKDRSAAARGEVPVGIFNANAFKNAVHAQLGIANPGERYVHIPAALRGAWPDPSRVPAPPHRWFSQLTAEQRDAQGRWDRKASHAANEVWDLMVMTQVMAHLHASRIDWRKSPPWAAEWEHNTAVCKPEAEKAPVKMPTRTPLPQAVDVQRAAMFAPRSAPMPVPPAAFIPTVRGNFATGLA